MLPEQGNGRSHGPFEKGRLTTRSIVAERGETRSIAQMFDRRERSPGSATASSGRGRSTPVWPVWLRSSPGSRFEGSAGKRRSGSRRSRSVAVPVTTRRSGCSPRVKGIYHVGCTDYPDPTYPWPCRWGSGLRERSARV